VGEQMKLEFYVKKGCVVKTSNYVENLIDVFPYVETNLTQKAWIDEKVNLYNNAYSTYPEQEYTIMPILMDMDDKKEVMSEMLEGFITWV
jgi:hypothetical protein